MPVAASARVSIVSKWSASARGSVRVVVGRLGRCRCGALGVGVYNKPRSTSNLLVERFVRVVLQCAAVGVCWTCVLKARLIHSRAPAAEHREIKSWGGVSSESIVVMSTGAKALALVRKEGYWSDGCGFASLLAGHIGCSHTLVVYGTCLGKEWVACCACSYHSWCWILCARGVVHRTCLSAPS